MNIAQPIPATVTSISFSFLTTEDIRRISVTQITNPTLLNDLNRPNVGGLYDPKLGPSDKNDICATCRQSYFRCPGHYGHIELPSPVFHPLFMTQMLNILRATCLFCHRFKASRTVLAKFCAKLILLERGLLEAASGVDKIQPLSRKSQEGDEEEGEKETVAEEVMQDYHKKIQLYVQLHLAMASQTKRDHYKDTLVYQERKVVMSEFLKATLLKKCQNGDCEAYAYSLRKDGHTKIVELDLSPKQKSQHEAKNLRRPNVLKEDRSIRLKQSSESRPMDVDVDASQSEESDDDGGEPTHSDDDLDTQGNDVQKSVGVAKSASGRVKSARGRNERVMPPEECRAHLRRLFASESVMCGLLFGRHGPLVPVSDSGLSKASADMFFLDCLLVPPTRFRPPASMGDQLFEHPQNELLAKVLTTSYLLRDLNNELRQLTQKDSGADDATIRKVTGRLLDGLVQLQVDVNSFMDSSKNPTRLRQGKLPPAGVKQGLEKKEGLFRMHMMGKRVNYAARSVISPDVNIETNEIGIPPVFAKKLTFPEPVTAHNFHKMRELVMRGPHQHPGAVMVEFEDGHRQMLDKMNEEQRRALANQLLTPQTYDVQRSGLSTRTYSVNKKVFRHVQDGDNLILNRQPTLHKPSMMVHKARVLHGEKTIRMHYANCNSYNADFDGDEMNIHFPQNHVAQAEAQFIANTDNQYLVPTSGKPLRGLIQDHVVAGVWMTNRESLFSREEYFQLLYGALRPEEDSVRTGRLLTLPPTIWKPKPLWTGKQIISTILLNIKPRNAAGLNLTSKAKVNGELWGKNSEEGKVLFMDGELLCGVLDKSQFGASDYGLVHSVYELYGAEVAGKLLSILSRLFTKYLQHRAFTCRMDDLTLTRDGDSKRKEILLRNRNLGTEGAMENFPSLADTPSSEKPNALRGFLQEVLRDDSKMAGLDMTVKKKLARLTKDIADACMPHKLSRQFPHNHMQMMTQSGAKGSAVNAQQISCALGQQELEGRRVPVMVSGKTLPSFKAFETDAIAGGYVASRFLTGVKPQEFYFHCMAGREGLIDTAVKTSRSGYLQRCLIKHLEGIRVHYDNTVRGSDNSVYQFNYGGDSLDVTKQKHLYDFEFSVRNYASLVHRYSPKSLSTTVIDDETVIAYMKKALKAASKGPAKAAEYPPALSLYNPSRYLGATSEKFAKAVQEYVKSNPDSLLKSKHSELPKWLRQRHDPISSHTFKTLMNVRYMRSLVDPGEAVGLLASQGVGEPSTQMTLNTFHFAGHGAANVTLGIPRLREIVMTASTKPKTPSMTLPVREGVPLKEVEAFCKRASRLSLSQLVDKVIVNERLATSRHRMFTVTIHFYPMNECREEYDTTSSEILAAFGSEFPSILRKELMLELKKLQADIRTHLADVGKGKASNGSEANENDGVEDGEDPLPKEIGNDSDSEIGDGDATAEKRARQSKQQATYESDDDEDNDDEPPKEFNDEALEAEFEDDSNGKDNKMEVDGSSKRKTRSLANQATVVREMFMGNLKSATSFSFNESQAKFELEFGSDLPKLLLVGIVERACLKTVVREIPGIAECFVNKEDKQPRIVTNGSNFAGLWRFAGSHEHEILDMANIYSNDIHAGLITYGVEMARAAILKEIQGVFGAYKIEIDGRHLELIADYMTFDGGYKPFNRKGISSNSSPLLKASYETTAAFLSDATLYGDFDDLRTPSSNIVLGRPSLTGTGAFDIVQPLVA